MDNKKLKNSRIKKQTDELNVRVVDSKHKEKVGLLSEVRVSYQAVHGLPYISYRRRTIIRNCRADSQNSNLKRRGRQAHGLEGEREGGKEGSMGRGKGEGEKKRGRGREEDAMRREKEVDRGMRQRLFGGSSPQHWVQGKGYGLFMAVDRN